MRQVVSTPAGFIIAFDLTLARICDNDVMCGLYLTQHNFWSMTEGDQEGWICKTAVEWQRRTCLTRNHQDRVRDILKRRCFIEEELRGMPAKRWSRLLPDPIQTAISAAWGDSQIAEIQQTRLLESSKQDCANSANCTIDTRARLKKEFKKDLKETPIVPLEGDRESENFSEQVKGRKKVRRKAYEAVDYSEIFERFWRVYPRKVAKSQAWDIWQRDKCDKVFDALIRSMETDESLKREKEFIPYPSTWLRHRRWEDEPAEVKTYKPIREMLNE